MNYRCDCNRLLLLSHAAAHHSPLHGMGTTGHDGEELVQRLRRRHQARVEAGRSKSGLWGPTHSLNSEDSSSAASNKGHEKDAANGESPRTLTTTMSHSVYSLSQPPQPQEQLLHHHDNEEQFNNETPKRGATTTTSFISISPSQFMTPTSTRMKSSPAGLEVVGELISSKTTRVARSTLATKLSANTPAIAEHV